MKIGKKIMPFMFALTLHPDFTTEMSAPMLAPIHEVTISPTIKTGIALALLQEAV